MQRFFILAGILLFPVFLFAGKSPNDYPLKVHILQISWGSHNTRFDSYRATGRGNLWEGGSVHAFDFTYDCSFPARRTARNQPYLAKWKKPQLQLELLAKEIGKDSKFDTCGLKTSVHDGVYILGQGGITEMSQENYAKWKVVNKENAAAEKTDAARLSIASTPVSAEIEIDGEFVGNTPSVLELDPGEHNVTVRKTGYKAWEKKVKLTAGQITLNAELEQESAK